MTYLLIGAAALTALGARLQGPKVPAKGLHPLHQERYDRIFSAQGAQPRLASQRFSTEAFVTEAKRQGGGQVHPIKDIRPPSGTQRKNLVLTNQVGYDLTSPKRFAVVVSAGDAARGGGKYRIMDCKSGKVVFEGELTNCGPFAKSEWYDTDAVYLAGDFTALKHAGDYVIEVLTPVAVKSAPIVVDDEVLFAKMAPICGLDYLYNRGMGPSDKKPEPQGGWWTDIGCPNEVFGTAPCVLGLAAMYEARPEFWKKLGRDKELIEELRWGLRGLNDRQLESGGFKSGARDDILSGVAIAAYARLARAEYLSEQERADCLRRGMLSWRHFQAHQDTLEWDHPAWEMHESEPLQFSVLSRGAQVLGGIELYAATKDPNVLDQSVVWVKDACRDWDIVWPYYDGRASDCWQSGIAPGALVLFALRHPDRVPPELTKALERWVAHVRQTDGNGVSANPLRMVAFDQHWFLHYPYWANNLKETPWTEFTRKDWRATLYPQVKGFQTPWSGWSVGHAGRHLTLAWALTLAGQWSKDPALREIGQNQFNWVCGLNPEWKCLVWHIGQHFFCGGWHWGRAARDGKTYNDPGAISNGWGGCDPEPWTPYNGWLMILLAEWSTQNGPKPDPSAMIARVLPSPRAESSDKNAAAVFRLDYAKNYLVWPGMWDLGVTILGQIVAQYPNTAQAAEAQQLLDDIKAGKIKQGTYQR